MNKLFSSAVEPELGNMCFGNSRGQYSLERGMGLEEEIIRLCGALEPSHDNSWREINNKDLFMMPYWWGDCTCGYDFIDDGHTKLMELKHLDSCYQIEYEQYENKYGVCEDKEDKGHKILAEIYEKYGFKNNGKDWWHGCAVRCSCDYDKRARDIELEYAKEFGNDGHKPDCKLVLPNFWYKPSDIQIQWYKYPLRDAYSNRIFTLKEFSNIVDLLIKKYGKED